jgi:membrane dipeptidase
MGRCRSITSRRRFLTALTGAGGAILLAPDGLQSAPVDMRVAQIVARTIAVDMHSHVQVPFRLSLTDAVPDPEHDLASEMKRSGFSAVCQTYGLDTLGGEPEAGDYYNYHQQAFAFEDRLLARNRMGRALNMRDLRTAHDRRQPIIVQSVEGAQFLDGRLERLEEACQRGLRHLQPLHERDDLVSPLGDVYTAPPHLGGLTSFGKQVIKECNRLGIVADLAHGTSETIAGALKASKQPVIVSHTGLSGAASRRSVTADMQRRLIDRGMAREVAAAGGVVGVWWRLVQTVAEYVTGIKDMVDAIGVDHVGIGTDTDLTASYSVPYTNKIWPDENSGFFYSVAGEMLKQGFGPEDVGKIGGGNFCRVFAQVTGGHA